MAAVVHLPTPFRTNPDPRLLFCTPKLHLSLRAPRQALVSAPKTRRSAFVRGRQREKASSSRQQALVHRRGAGTCDPELRLVLELASDEELFEIESILFSRSFFSPLLKSIVDRPDMDYALDMDDVEEREKFIDHLESRFFFLAADSGSTLRGWRPSYREVLLCLRRKLHIPCSSKLSTTDLEVEIFLHLLREYSSSESSSIHLPWYSNVENNLELGLNHWKVDAFAALKVGAKEVQQIVFKGGGILTLEKIYQLFAKRLSGKMLVAAADYQIKREVIKKGGQIAAMNLESRTALLASRLGFASAASRYLGLRNLMKLAGPLLWGTFLADMVIQMLGTDYARILRAIYALAQIRLTRQHQGISNCS